MNKEASPAPMIWSWLKDETGPIPSGGPWLRRHPSQLARCIQERAGHLPRPLDEAERGQMRTAHERWGADKATLAAIDALGQPQTRVIITGQQPALLTGPLYTLYKALAAVKLARELAAQNPVLTFVPVFWVASEDHDFAEIQQACWPGQSGQIEKFAIPEALNQPGRTVGRLPLAPVLNGLREAIERTTFKTEFRAELLRLLEGVYGGDATLEDGFCRLILRLLAGSGLVVVSPFMPWVRRRAQAIFEQEFAHPGRSSEAVIARGEALHAAGFEPTLHRTAEAVNAFWLDENGRRHALRWQDGQVRRVPALAGGGAAENSTAEDETATGSVATDAPEDPVTIDTSDQAEPAPWSLDELRRRLAGHPEEFSMNVVTRPLVQDAILPTVAQVVGPGEASYLAQVEAVYDAFGVFVPVRFPRPQATLIEPRVARNLEKQGIHLEEACQASFADLTDAVLRRELESSELHELDQVYQRQLDEIQELAEKLGAGSSAIDSAFAHLIQAVKKGYEKIIERILYQRQQEERRLSQAITLISNSLRPNNQPQERQFNPLVPYAINYGLDWAARLGEKLEIAPATPVQRIHLAQFAPSEPPAADATAK